MAAVPVTAANAAKLPQIRINQHNHVPACVTPGRLMAFLQRRNKHLAPKFAKIANFYMRHGEALGIRWDEAFYQMLVETNYLQYGRDVSASQNNFAGLGATGGGEPGESFKSVSDGVKAHLQHILMYAGEKIRNPVAERTRKVQEWGILDKWRRRIGRPLTYTDLTRKWSPGDRGYARDIKVTGDHFLAQLCDKPDPHPEWVAEARGAGKKKVLASANKASSSSKAVVRNYAADAIKRGKRQSNNTRSGLGATTMASAGALPFTILNAPQAPVAKAPSATTGPTAKTGPAATATTAGPQAAVPTSKMKCNVFTASYGGQKAVIIKAVGKHQINYTVLDINEGNETSETEAYIAAYAKGGTTVGKFPSQTQALDKAFQLCPEG